MWTPLTTGSVQGVTILLVSRYHRGILVIALALTSCYSISDLVCPEGMGSLSLDDSTVLCWTSWGDESNDELSQTIDLEWLSGSAVDPTEDRLEASGSSSEVAVTGRTW